MPEIRLLPESLQNLIAAGEVIERPASVVKELVENSIDAGGRDLRIEVQKGGKRLIRVSDDGRGMDRDDALLCFQKHATSKISKPDDLNCIITMGFRGEALASITAVSRTRLRTAPEGTTEGTEVEIEGGEVKSVKSAAAVGTTVEVRDLFFNVPARRKFLKSDHTELYHIIEAVTSHAIIHPSLGFTLNSGGKPLLNLPVAGSLKERLGQLYGTSFVKELLEIRMGDGPGGIRVEGFISRPGNYRKRRSHQYLFVNRRPVVDAALRHAVYRAYEDYMKREDHPIFFIHLEIDPTRIDVNVHPAKREIRFVERELIYDVLLDTFREYLRESLRAEAGNVERGEGSPTTPEMTVQDQEGVSMIYSTALPAAPDHAAEPAELAYEVQRDYIYLGDVFVAYADGRGLCIIDHHAAHERILYEKLKSGLKSETYGLLFPRQVRLGAKEYSVLVEYREMLKEMGFDIEDFGASTVIVRTLPGEVDEKGLEALLSDMAHSIMEFRKDSPLDEIRDGLARRVACHASVRGRAILSREEINRLLRDLDNAEDPHHCPHGRPTRLYFSLDDLRKMFERK